MLPPQLHGGMASARRHSLTSSSAVLHHASATNLIRVGSAYTQSRSFWGWRKRFTEDWSSHLDPVYHRLTHHRNLQTRAKLLEKLKRRGKFDWDVNQKPFFTSKHIRWASHWNGRGGPQWLRYASEKQDDKPKKPDNRKTAAEEQKESEDEAGLKKALEHMERMQALVESRLAKERRENDIGYELSRREKEWKEQMEAMRKRIERDPYEAIFGKRFEPFWSPLVPSWMREEMGLQGWPKAQKEPSKTNTADSRNPSLADLKNNLESVLRSEKELQSETVRKPDTTDTAATRGSTSFTELRSESRAEAKEEASEPKAVPYSSYSSTSWDSWTNKARRTEWDSQSGQIKRYEYDPVSNRMVQVDEPAGQPEPQKTAPAESTSVTGAKDNRSTDMKSLINTPGRLLAKKLSEEEAVDIPVKKYSGERQSIPINAEVKEDKSKGPLGFAPTASNVAAPRNEKPSMPPKPAALAKLPKDDLDLLTAENVRASMGKMKQQTTDAVKPSTPEEKAAMENDFDRKVSETDTEIAAILQERNLAMSKEAKESQKAAEWDKAEEAVFLERELDTLKRKKSKLLNDEHGLFHIERQKRELAKLDQRIEVVRRRLPEKQVAESASNPVYQTSNQRLRELQKGVETALESTGRMQDSLETALGRYERAQRSSNSSPTLQPAVECMQTKELEELDDSAAHECIGPVETSTNVPKEWSKQTELLQADRVKRTASKWPYPMKRWIDDMTARKAAYEASKAPSPAELAAEAERNAKLEKSNAMLEAEVKEQKFRMQAHENRYAHKIRSLRQELETAYKQSAVHSEKHVERIRFLETELAKANKAAGGEGASVRRTDVDAMKAVQGEGDFCPNITKWADSPRWYKQPAVAPSAAPSKQEMEKAAQKARDQALVKEVREIYEKQYGVIDTNHRQAAQAKATQLKSAEPKQVVEVESDVDLGEALAEHEKHQGYGFQKDNLEAEIAAQEKEAHEAQHLMGPERLTHVRNIMAKVQKRSPSSPLPGPKLVNDGAPKLIPTTVNDIKDNTSTVARSSEAAKIELSVEWEEPPVYKVLAYDSGNDRITTATTTSNFTGSESPISIPQALSQLYQPARFVSHFAELQQEGYQVIYGTRDLLVFKKVKQTAAAPKSDESISEVQPEAALVDHGLLKPKENALAQEAANFYDLYKPSPPEYDATSIENGKLMPYENAMAQEAANAYDNARSSVNPIDGMRTAPPEVTTGNYASPTGFVNHDSVLSEEDRVSERRWQDEDVDYVHYPRVRRQESVFSGTRRTWNDRHARHQSQHQHRREKPRRRGALRWALSVGVGAAGLTYLIGVAAEAARQEKQAKERWQEVLEGKRGRWD